jgi:hypothetical protein
MNFAIFRVVFCYFVIRSSGAYVAYDEMALSRFVWLYQTNTAQERYWLTTKRLRLAPGESASLRKLKGVKGGLKHLCTVSFCQV